MTLVQLTPQTAEALLVAVPSVAPGGLEAAIAPHFGRCTCFTIVRMEQRGPQQAQVVNKTPDSGCQASVGLLKGHGVQVLLCQHVGLQPFNACRENGILVLTTAAPTVAEALSAYTQQALLPLTEQGACNAHSGWNRHHMAQEHFGHGQGNCGRR